MNTYAVTCYFCDENYIITESLCESFGHFYNINSDACSEFVCNKCDTTSNLIYVEEWDNYFDQEGYTRALYTKLKLS